MEFYKIQQHKVAYDYTGKKSDTFLFHNKKPPLKTIVCSYDFRFLIQIYICIYPWLIHSATTFYHNYCWKLFGMHTKTKLWLGHSKKFIFLDLNYSFVVENQTYSTHLKFFETS